MDKTTQDMENMVSVGQHVIDIFMLTSGKITSLEFKTTMQEKGFDVNQKRASMFLTSYFDGLENIKIDYEGEFKTYIRYDSKAENNSADKVDTSPVIQSYVDDHLNDVVAEVVPKTHTLKNIVDHVLSKSTIDEDEEMLIDENSVITHPRASIYNDAGVNVIKIEVDCDEEPEYDDEEEFDELLADAVEFMEAVFPDTAEAEYKLYQRMTKEQLLHMKQLAEHMLAQQSED